MGQVSNFSERMVEATVECCRHCHGEPYQCTYGNIPGLGEEDERLGRSAEEQGRNKHDVLRTLEQIVDAHQRGDPRALGNAMADARQLIRRLLPQSVVA